MVRTRHFAHLPVCYVHAKPPDHGKHVAAALPVYHVPSCAQWRLAGLVNSDHQLLRQQPVDAHLDDDNDANEEHPRTELY